MTYNIDNIDFIKTGILLSLILTALYFFIRKVVYNRKEFFIKDIFNSFLLGFSFSICLKIALIAINSKCPELEYAEKSAMTIGAFAATAVAISGYVKSIKMRDDKRS